MLAPSAMTMFVSHTAAGQCRHWSAPNQSTPPRLPFSADRKVGTDGEQHIVFLMFVNTRCSDGAELLASAAALQPVRSAGVTGSSPGSVACGKAVADPAVRMIRDPVGCYPWATSNPEARADTSQPSRYSPPPPAH